MKKKTVFPFLIKIVLILTLVSACEALPAATSSVQTGSGAAAIFITSPPDGHRMHAGQTADITSEVSASGASGVRLVVNGSDYYYDQLYRHESSFQIFQPWTPQEPGEYRIHTVLDASGVSAESNEITIYVDPPEEQEEEETEPTVTSEPAEEEEECPRPMATTHSFANCRSGPGTGYPITAGLTTGREFYILGKSYSGTWWQVEETSGVFTCWVWANLVDTCGDLDEVPMVNIPEKDEVVEEPPTEETEEVDTDDGETTPTETPDPYGPTTPG